MTIFIRSNWSAIERELDRLEKAPDKSKFYLDRVLNVGFKATQGAVHVITMSLKLSGKKSSEMHGDTWTGHISYGGVSLGINNPVTYAIYEKARDGDHDFFTPLKALDSLYVEAILKVLR
jgi:hypothetical protein